MKKKRQKPENIRVRCPYCGRMARLHPASYVYGSDNLDSESYLYVCDGYLITAMHMWVHIKNHFCRKGNWRMDSFVTNGF